MVDVICPHCGERAMPGWRKLMLGWNASVRCRSCDRKVTVSPLQALAACLPLLCVLALALAANGKITDSAYAAMMILLAVIAFFITSILYLAWVPLARAELTIVRRAGPQLGKESDDGGGGDKAGREKDPV